MTLPAAPPTPPLTEADLHHSLLPFGRSRMLPRAAYVSEAVLAWELEHLFAGQWTCLGWAGDLARPGSQRAVRVGPTGVLLVRGGDGVLRAFANLCRHRGHELLGLASAAAGGPAVGATGTPAGTVARRSIVCPYHAWSYTLEGSLRAAPGFRDLPGFDPAEWGLVPLPLEVWHGLLFVNATGDAPPLAEQLGELGDLVAPYRLADLVPGGEHAYLLAANWKVVCENYHECYHCPLIHPELCRVTPPDSGRNYSERAGAWVGGSMDLRDHAETMSADGRSLGAPIAGLDGEQLRTVLYLGVLPNLLLSLHPDYVMTHLLEPLGPASTRVTCTWYFPREAAERLGFDPSYATAFWDTTNRQDWAACESVQRGLASPHFRPGPMAPNEDAVHNFVSIIARAYLGVRPGS
jgi:Rieske 2Fe-2S family protein